MDYTIHFDVESVCQKFMDMMDHGTQDKSGIQDKIDIRGFKHNLGSSLQTIVGYADLFLKKEETANIYQRAYVHNLGNSAFVVLETLESLLALATGGKEDGRDEFMRAEPFMRLAQSSAQLVSTLKAISQYLPAAEIVLHPERVLQLEGVLQLQPLSSDAVQFLHQIDLSYAIAIYGFNREFSRSLQRHRLDLDAQDFWTSQYVRKDRPLIMMSDVKINPIETRVDYFSKVVLPVVQNIFEHAFNPQNDIAGRLQDGEFSREYTISSDVDKNKKEVIVTILDNGFGIRVEDLDKLFKTKFSTKIDTTTEHGICLLEVKKFVQINQGRIWIESKLGHYTALHFTIPYTETQQVKIPTKLYKQ